MLNQILDIFPVNQSNFPVNHPQKIKWLEDFAKYLGLSQNYFYDLFSYIFILVLIILIGYYLYNNFKSNQGDINEEEFSE